MGTVLKSDFQFQYEQPPRWETHQLTTSMEEFIAQSSRRILLVDDALGDAQLLAELMNYLGQEACAVGDGAQALGIVSSFAPDVVILDLDMPGLDGFEVAQALKHIPGLEKIGIFALSGWSDDSVRERCLQVGFDRFFSKPISANQILCALVEFG